MQCSPVRCLPNSRPNGLLCATPQQARPQHGSLSTHGSQLQRALPSTAMFGVSSFCPTQRLHGSCWTLTELGESCAQRCGGASLVDRSALLRLSSTLEVASHLERLYGIHATSKDAIDQPCADGGDSLYVFVPHGFTNYGGEGRWLPLRRVTCTSRRRRSPCICDPGAHHASPPPPPRRCRHHRPGDRCRRRRRHLRLRRPRRLAARGAAPWFLTRRGWTEQLEQREQRTRWRSGWHRERRLRVARTAATPLLLTPLLLLAILGCVCFCAGYGCPTRCLRAATGCSAGRLLQVLLQAWARRPLRASRRGGEEAEALEWRRGGGGGGDATRGA